MTIATVLITCTLLISPPAVHISWVILTTSVNMLSSSSFSCRRRLPPTCSLFAVHDFLSANLFDTLSDRPPARIAVDDASSGTPQSPAVDDESRARSSAWRSRPGHAHTRTSTDWRPMTVPFEARSRQKTTRTGRRLRPPTHELKQWNSSKVVTHSAPAASQHHKMISTSRNVLHVDAWKASF